MNPPMDADMPLQRNFPARPEPRPASRRWRRASLAWLGAALALALAAPPRTEGSEKVRLAASRSVYQHPSTSVQVNGAPLPPGGRFEFEVSPQEEFTITYSPGEYIYTPGTEGHPGPFYSETQMEYPYEVIGDYIEGQGYPHKLNPTDPVCQLMSASVDIPACTAFHRVSGSNVWHPGIPVSPWGEFESGNFIDCSHFPVPDPVTYHVRLADPNARGNDGDFECPACPPGGGGPAGEHRDSFGSGFGPGGSPAGPVQIAVPVASGDPIVPAMFAFHPAVPGTTDTTANGVRTLSTGYSRVEIEAVGGGSVVRVYDDLSPGAPPTHVREYTRVTDAVLGSGLRVAVAGSGATGTRDVFLGEPVASGGTTTQAWKTVSDGTEIREGVVVRSAAVRTEEVFHRRVLPSEAVVDTGREWRKYGTFAWGESLVESATGWGDEEVTTTYGYFSTPPKLRGVRSHWSDSTGAWERYLYDTGTGKLTHTLSPWLDAPATPAEATPQNCRAVVPLGTSTQTWILGQKILDHPVPSSPWPAPQTEKGDWNDATKTFTPSASGDATRTISRNSFATVLHRSTRTVTISDGIGTRRIGLEVLTGATSYTPLTRTDYAYDAEDRLVEIRRDGEVVSSTVHHPDGTRTVTEEDGSSTTYSAEVPGSDDSSQTRHGGGLFPDLVSASATTRQNGLSTTVRTRSAGGLSVASSSTGTPGGRLLSTTDELGRTTTYAYATEAATGRRTETETGPGGVTRTVTYHRDGQLHSVTGSGVVAEHYEYAPIPASGGYSLLSTTVRYGAPDSPRWRRTVTNGSGRLVREESPLPGGRVLARIHQYDGQGRLLGVQRSGGLATERTEYDALGRVFRRGLDLDGNGQLQPASPDRFLETDQFYEEAEGGWWEVSTTSAYLTPGDPAKTELSRTRRRLGLGADSRTLVSRADGSVLETTTTLDLDTGTLTVTSRANASDLDAVSVYRHGRLVSQSSLTVAEPVLYGYDALGRLASVTDPRTGQPTTLAYNPAGQRLSVTRPGGLATRYAYYPADHPNAGALRWSEDGLGKRTYRAYDALGRPTHQWGPAAQPLRHLYNVQGDLAELHTWREGGPSAWDGESLPAAFDTLVPDTTTWVHDPASGLLVQKKDADGQGPLYAYSDAGLLQSRTWARGVATTYAYSNAGDLLSIAYGDGTPGVTRTYRRDGRLASTTDAAGTTTYAFTGPLPTGESVAGGLLDGLVLSYPQALGRRQGFTATLGSDTVSAMGYAYDSRGRLAGLSEAGIGPGGFAAEFAYATHSDRPQTTLSKAEGSPVLTGTRTYDDADRLTSLAYARPGNEVVTSHAYTLDDADRRTKATREDATAWHYGYNERDEVTSAVKRLPNDDPLAGWQQQFAYDHLGNRTWAREGGDTSGANLRQTDYTANALNQYTRIARPGAFDVLGRAPSNVGVTVNDLPVVRQGGFWRAELDGLPNALAALWQSVSVDALDPGAGPGGADLPAHRFGHRFVPPALETPLYDSDGNLVSDARWTYAWDAENRLVEVRTGPAALAAGVPGERYRYTYDSRARRIGRTVERWNPDTQAWVPKTSERFVHDDWNVVAVVDAAGDVVQRYAWGNDLSGTPQAAGGVGGLLAAWDAVGNRAWCYAYDGNGNVSAVVDLADGTKVGRYDYDAFGRTIAQWGDEELCEANPYRFSTKPLDGTGLYHYGFRYYNPETGRWLSRDPIEERGGINLCGFVGNDGVGNIDRLGLDPHYPQPPSLPPSAKPVLGNHTGDVPIGDQTDWFDENFSGLREQAESNLKERVRLNSQSTVCRSQRWIEYFRMEGEVVLAVIPRNFSDPEFHNDPSYSDPGNPIVFDDALGDRPQSYTEARWTGLGRFAFRLAPQNLRLRTVRQGMGQYNPDQGKAEYGSYYEYSAIMELRDNVGAFSGKTVTRATWTVRGSYFCPCSWKR